jgi:murein DD-endopeptidase MepM/ murein hydrolase activator NlpD
MGAILTASYLAEDADIDNAEVAYTEWEIDLQQRIADTESTHGGYDEYRYSVGDISHNPYELMAYLTVRYQNFAYAAIEADLRAMFSEQYALAFTPSVETRYADPTDADGDGYYEPYAWNVLTVTLTARSFSEVVASRLSGEQLAHYALLMQTKGSRQYVGNPFAGTSGASDTDWLPYVTSYYGYRIHPISGAKDLHRGVDIAFASGTEIKSAQDGVVTFAGYSGDYGNVVVIENENGLVTKYAHCETLLVSTGQAVSMGDAIATVGSTGASTGPHLHFEVLKDGTYLNPLYFADTGSFNLGLTYGYAGSPMGDGSYAALIAEAERYLGYPYVWGGSSPSTSFDCSGYVSWVLTQSGVRNTGRLTAQGLFNISNPVTLADARPGDLVFFHSTYSTPNTVTHVGIYVGTDAGGRPRMIHCGNPIGYAYLDTAYWQNHFYAFGRIT